MIEINTKLKFFSGKWFVNRFFTDKADGKLIAVGRGFVSFDVCNESEIKCTEKLRVKWQNRESLIARATYTLKDVDGDIYKYSKQGQLLYQIIFGIDESEASGFHECGNDAYSSSFKFIDEQSFKQTYDVFGPMKNFTIESEYIKEKLLGSLAYDFSLKE